MPVIAIAPCSKQHDYEEAVRRAHQEAEEATEQALSIYRRQQMLVHAIR